jgi:hypothetical protein
VIAVATVHLPAMGTARAPVDMDFPWFGVSIRVAPNAGNPLLLLGFARRAEKIDSVDDVSSMLIVMDFLKGLVHSEDWDEFMRVAVANNQQTMDLLEVAKVIVVEVARFPTGRQSDSPDGPPSTTTRSGADPYSAAVVTTMDKLKGRGDLKLIVYQNYLARRQMQAAAS